MSVATRYYRRILSQFPTPVETPNYTQSKLASLEMKVYDSILREGLDLFPKLGKEYTPKIMGIPGKNVVELRLYMMFLRQADPEEIDIDLTPMDLDIGSAMKLSVKQLNLLKSITDRESGTESNYGIVWSDSISIDIPKNWMILMSKYRHFVWKNEIHRGNRVIIPLIDENSGGDYIQEQQVKYIEESRKLYDDGYIPIYNGMDKNKGWGVKEMITDKDASLIKLPWSDGRITRNKVNFLRDRLVERDIMININNIAKLIHIEIFSIDLIRHRASIVMIPTSYLYYFIGPMIYLRSSIKFEALKAVTWEIENTIRFYPNEDIKIKKYEISKSKYNEAVDVAKSKKYKGLVSVYKEVVDREWKYIVSYIYSSRMIKLFGTDPWMELNQEIHVDKESVDYFEEKE